jgi:hypothetical protein
MEPDSLFIQFVGSDDTLAEAFVPDCSGTLPVDCAATLESVDERIRQLIRYLDR